MADPASTTPLLRRLFGPVRTRTALAATAVVAVALAAAGVAVVLVVRSSLTHSAELRAAAQVRDVAARTATTAALSALELPDAGEYPTQLVDASGRVVAASGGLSGMAPLATVNRPTPAATTDDDSDDDSRTRSGHGRGNGRSDGSDDDTSGSTAGTVTFTTTTLPVDDDGAPVPAGTGKVRGHAAFRVAAEQATTPGGTRVTIYTAASLADARQAASRTGTAVAIAVPALVLLVGGVTWVMAGRALRPVEAIRAELSEITAGDLSRRVPQPRIADEIGRLAHTTNTTLAALEASVERQHRFVADASHELRSPLASIRTQLEVAQAHPDLLRIDDVLADTVRLQDLATDLLLLARLDAGDRPRTTPLDLAALVTQQVRHRAADRIPVRLHAADAAPVAGSRPQLVRVLANLLDNAQRHASQQVRATVDQEPPGRGVVLIVEDDGAGITTQDRDRVFERFVRLDEARSRDEGGAGLGLAIVRDVVLQHGGTVAVDRSPLGGARFTVRLPARDAPD